MKNRLAWNILQKLPPPEKPCDGFVALPKEDLVSSYKSILTVVTIATDESFKDVSDFVINLDKVEPTVPIVIYDLGISQNNLQLVFDFTSLQ